MREAKTALAEALRWSAKAQNANRADIASGVLNGRQVESPGLQPAARNIVEILGIRTDLLEQCQQALMCAKSCVEIYGGVFLTRAWSRQMRSSAP